MLKMMKVMMHLQAQTNRYLANIQNSSNVAKDKVSNIEIRQNMDTKCTCGSALWRRRSTIAGRCGSPSQWE